MVNEGHGRQPSPVTTGSAPLASLRVVRSISTARPVIEILRFHTHNGVAATQEQHPSPDEALWRVAILPDEAPVPLHDIERHRVDTVVRAAPEAMSATAEVLATIFSRPQYIGLDLNDLLAVATGRARAGKALVLAGAVYDTMTAPVRHWLDTLCGNGFSPRSLLIVQLLRPADEPAFDMPSFSGFCDAVLASCGIEEGLITACGDAKATMAAILAFGDAT